MTPWILLLSSLGMSAFLLQWSPTWSRECVLFGVTVPAGFRDTAEGRRLMNRFRGGLWLATFAGTLCGLVFPLSTTLSVAILVQVAGAIASYVWTWRQTKHFAVRPSSLRQASLAAEEASYGGWASWLPFLLLLGVGLYLQSQWTEIPARFPTHWNVAGEANMWAERSWRSVYFPLATGTGTLLMMRLMMWAMVSGARRGPIQRPMLRVATGVMWILAVTFGAVALFPLFGKGAQPPVPLWVFPVGVLTAMGGLLLWLVRSADWEGRPGDATPDECWKWGQFYYNPEDPAVMVEKRFGIGYTLNFANRKAWVLLGTTLGLSLLLPLLLKRL